MNAPPVRQLIGRVRRKLPSAWATGSLSAAYLADALATLVQVAITARLLDADEFGQLGIAMAWTLIGSSLLDFRVWEAMTVMVPKLRLASQANRAGGLVAGCFLLEMAGGIVISTLLLLAAPLAAMLLAKSVHALPLFLLLALLPTLQSLEEPARTPLRLHAQFDRLAMWRAGTGILQCLLVVMALMIVPSPASVVLAILIAWGVRLAILLPMSAASLRALGIHPLSAGSRPWIKPLLSRNRQFFLATMLAAVGGRLSNRVDVLLLAYLTTPVIVAPYELARRLTAQAQLVLTPLSQVMYPKISSLVAEGSSEQHNFLRNLTAALAVVFLPLLALAYLLVSVIVPTVFGDKLSGAVPLAQVLLIAYAQIPLFWLRPFLLCSGHVNFVTAASWISVLILVVACVSFIPRAGGLGAAWAVVMAQLSWVILLSGRALLARRALGAPQHSQSMNPAAERC